MITLLLLGFALSLDSFRVSVGLGTLKLSRLRQLQIVIAFGVCDALSSFTFGHIAKYINRIYCLIFAALINYAVIIAMSIWIPQENELWVFFIVAGLWGIADGVWQTQSK